LHNVFSNAEDIRFLSLFLRPSQREYWADYLELKKNLPISWCSFNSFSEYFCLVLKKSLDTLDTHTLRWLQLYYCLLLAQDNGEQTEKNKEIKLWEFFAPSWMVRFTVKKNTFVSKHHLIFIEMGQTKKRSPWTNWRIFNESLLIKRCPWKIALNFEFTY
jgi:hypothetical protein